MIAAALSIPSGILHVVAGDEAVNVFCTFNSFGDSTEIKRVQDEAEANIFQFLRGFYGWSSVVVAWPAGAIFQFLRGFYR